MIKVGGAQCGEFERVVALLCGNTEQQDLCSREDLIDKRITFLTLRLLVTAIIQFNPDEWAHGVWLAQHKIDMLARDAVEKGVKIGAGRDEKEILQSDFWADNGLIAGDGNQDMIQ